MSLDIHGKEPEENCVHCYLWPIMEKWHDEHPGVSTESMISGVLQMAAELVGSAIVNSEADLDRESKRAEKYLDKAIRDNVYEYRRLGLGKNQS